MSHNKMDEDELREKIAEWYRRIHNYQRSAMNICRVRADAILSLLDSAPSGLQAQRECKHYELGLYGNVANCSECHGTGFITRDLTQREAIELLKNLTYIGKVYVSGELISVIVKEG